MVIKEKVNGITECLSTIEKHKDKKNVFILLSGDKDDSGNSWCPDCVKAEPVVMSCVDSLKEDDVYIYCLVGDRAAWKDPENSFRIHNNFKLKSIPTLLKYNSLKQLCEEDCKKEDLVRMLFEED